jgi:hypothetical protein
VQNELGEIVEYAMFLILYFEDNTYQLCTRYRLV